MCLARRPSATRDAILKGMEKHPEGVPKLELLHYLGMRDYDLYKALAAAVRPLPEAGVPVAALPSILDLVRELEGRRRGELREAAQDILDRAQDGDRPTRMVLDAFVHTVVDNLSAYAEQRVSELRRALTVCPHLRERVPQHRYVIERLDAAEIVCEHLGHLHGLFGRAAWLKPVGYLETKWFWSAQVGFRRALGSGYAGPPPRPRGRPLRELPDPKLRGELEALALLSDRLGTVFMLFYEPYHHPTDRCFKLGRWARPYAVRLARFLNEARMRIVHAMNELFGPLGFETYALIAQDGCFPIAWVPPGTMPRQPCLRTDAELEAEYEYLTQVAFEHLEAAEPGAQGQPAGSARLEAQPAPATAAEAGHAAPKRARRRARPRRAATPKPAGKPRAEEVP